jgi:hypothetical protein
MGNDKAEATQPSSGPGAEPGRAADVPTKPSRPGTAAHQRHVHELAAEERRKAEEKPVGSSETGRPGNG